MSLNKSELVHKDLYVLRDRLRNIYRSAASFEPLTPRPPIIDTSIIDEDTQWRSDNVPGMRLLRDAIKGDLERLEAFLADAESADIPPISTNSPYLIAVWNEILAAIYPVVSIFRTFDAPGEGSIQQQKRRNDVQNGPPGVKVDVVCKGGSQWIRVNTIKNSRLMAELREIDSYDTGSDSDTETTPKLHQPSLAQKDFDNSLLRMGRSLLASSNENPAPGSTHSPQVTIRLTRLNPIEPKADPRIARTIQCLQDMGIDVQMGEMNITDTAPPRDLAHVRNLQPTLCVNLDLSAVIALVSDLTHAPLPRTTEEASARFQPSEKYLEWKKQRINISQSGKQKKKVQSAEQNSLDKGGPNVHARALTAQVMQEMVKGLLEEMRDRLFGSPVTAAATSSRKIQFWTTPEVRDRCLRILSKIGGTGERRRANALFPPGDTDSIESREAQYWHESRYAPGYIPILPIHIYPSSEPESLTGSLADLKLATAAQTPFFKTLATTCRDILAQETVPHPRALPQSLVTGATVDEASTLGEIQRAAVTKANPRLTAHTVQSMLWGAELGWTTLTANKSSVKAIWRDMKAARDAGNLERGDKQEGEEAIVQDVAAIWIVDPRSLAEGQRSDFSG
ncbi:hypothetical protein HWV62_24962 [Athelia sp. TMB]|nr:hypothetical protein HWV62_24962 [Athelia sp. TMB]